MKEGILLKVVNWILQLFKRKIVIVYVDENEETYQEWHWWDLS